MTKILFIGDLHFKKTNTDKTDKILEIILNSKTKYAFVVLLGDILHTHDKIDMWCHIRACNFIKSIASIFKTFVIIGNHDRPNNKVFCLKGVNAFSSISSKVTIVDYPLIYTYNDVKFCFIPYVEDNRFKEAVKLVMKEEEMKEYIFFAHQNFKGSGFDYNCTEAFEGKLCISGHIHDEKWVSFSNKKNLFYTEEKSIYEVSISSLKKNKNEIKNIFKFEKKIKQNEKESIEEIKNIFEEKIEKLNFLELIKIKLEKDNKNELFKFFSE